MGATEVVNTAVFNITNTTYHGIDVLNTSYVYNESFNITVAQINVTNITNGTRDSASKPHIRSIEHLILTSVILGLMILSTIIGNVFVIAAVILEKNLHNVANYLILSLAVADCMVATLVMPISVVNEVTTSWYLRAEVCDMWISFDVLCCTASILHLVAISVDRYKAVTNIDYVRNRKAKQILLMIAIAWTVGICISIPPLFGWKDPKDSPDNTGECIISQDYGYTIFSTMGAFYLPTIIMMIIYFRIYQVARYRIRKKNFMKKMSNRNKNLNNLNSKPSTLSPSINGHAEVTVLDRESSVYGLNDNNENSKLSTNGHLEGRDETKIAMLPKNNNEAMKAKRQKEKLEMRRERKAARTLGIITGAYIMCWLPFFIIALIGPFVKDYVEIPPVVNSTVLWLGYANSLLNPIIYTIFSPEFRHAFQKIMFGKYYRQRRK